MLKKNTVTKELLSTFLKPDQLKKTNHLTLKLPNPTVAFLTQKHWFIQENT